MLTERQWTFIRAVLAPILILAWFAVLFVVGMALGRVIREVILLVLAAVIAYAITPLVGLLVRYIPGLPRALAILLAYLIGFLIIAAMLGVVGVTATSQIAALVRHLPDYINHAQRLEPRALALLRPFGIGNHQLEQARNSLIDQVRGAGTAIATGALTTVTAIAGGVVDAFVALILSVYLTANGPRIARGLRNAGAGVGWGRRVSGFITMFNQILGGYVRGTLLLALMVGVLVTVLMAALGVPYAILLGVIAFFMEFVPVFGVFISGAICVLLALGTVGWERALIALAGFVVLHFLEGELVGPRIMGKAVGIHPAVSLMALIVGTDLFGIWGALLGAPAAGLLQALVLAGWREFRRSDLLDPGHQEPGAPRRHKVRPRDDGLAAAAEAASRGREEQPAREGG
ncbi:MAG: AI-2E family transporter [Candidatus Dormibacteraeota bacterium]|nr:AI-2E family transporter [Candidatus Dormibacteraeota bacterium]